MTSLPPGTPPAGSARAPPTGSAAARRALRRGPGVQCTGSSPSPHPPTATAPSTGPDSPGASASRSTAHHHSAPIATARAVTGGMPSTGGMRRERRTAASRDQGRDPDSSGFPILPYTLRRRTQNGPEPRPVHQA
ncbi:hypothetical protein ACFXOJ_33640, partial [Streptomyces vinaceus]